MVPSETFFATVAQVFPALLIAFAVEAVALLRDPLRGWRQRVRRRNIRMYEAVREEPDRRQRVRRGNIRIYEAVQEEEPDWRQFERWQRRFEDGEVRAIRERMAIAAYCFLAMVIVGEVGAMWVLFLGVHKNWFSVLAGNLCVVTMTFSIVVVAGMPIARLMLEVDTVAFPKLNLPRWFRPTVRVTDSWTRPATRHRASPTRPPGSGPRPGRTTAPRAAEADRPLP